MFDGDVNAIVDFKYSTDPRLTWWFDHHQSAFLTPEDAEHFRRDSSGQKMYDPSFRSCTMYIATVARERFGFDAPDLAELVEWADIVDGAQYASAEEAVNLVRSGHAPHAGDRRRQRIRDRADHHPHDAHPQAGRDRRRPADSGRLPALYERHLRSIDIIRKQAQADDGVVYFDLVGQELEGYNKFIPYYLFPDSVYTVSVSTSSFRTKVSVGSNPWATKPVKLQPGLHLRALRRRRPSQAWAPSASRSAPSKPPARPPREIAAELRTPNA